MPKSQIEKRYEKDPGNKRLINKTQLYPDKNAERLVIGRDPISHVYRWTHLLKWVAKLRNRENFSVLDVGCGDMPLLKTMYTNRMHPHYYLGLDARNLTISDSGVEPNFEAEFKQIDFVDNIPESKYGKWDLIAFLEVIEHVSKENGIKILENIKKVMNPDTYFFISTPIFDSKTMAANHIYEWKYEELKEQLESMFVIEKHYGTFSSQREIEPVLSDCEREIFEKLKEYYDSNVLSIIFAPLYPAQSRNAIWRCRLKNGE